MPGLPSISSAAVSPRHLARCLTPAALAPRRLLYRCVKFKMYTLSMFSEIIYAYDTHTYMYIHNICILYTHVHVYSYFIHTYLYIHSIRILYILVHAYSCYTYTYTYSYMYMHSICILCILVHVYA